MYRSLYSALKPLVFEGESGVLNCRHDYGEEGRIWIKEGLVAGAQTGAKLGKEAIVVMGGWLSAEFEFQHGRPELPSEPTVIAVDIGQVLSFLEKIDQKIPVIQKIIPSNDAIYKIVADQLDSGVKVPGKDLQFALKIDGHKTVEEIIRESQSLEIEVLASICRLTNAGVIEMAFARRPMDAAKRDGFLSALEEQLAEILGPAAGLLIEDTLADQADDLESITENELRRAVEQLRDHLEARDFDRVRKWADHQLG